MSDIKYDTRSKAVETIQCEIVSNLSLVRANIKTLMRLLGEKEAQEWLDQVDQNHSLEDKSSYKFRYKIESPRTFYKVSGNEFTELRVYK